MTHSIVRFLREDDRELVCSVAAEAYNKSKVAGKPWPKVNIHKLFDSLLEYNDTVEDFAAVVVNESFVIACQKAEAWFSTDAYLQELAFMRIAPRSLTSAAFMYLDDQAEHWGCKWIEFSTELSSNDEATSSLLQQAGYSRFGINHIKEISNG